MRVRNWVGAAGLLVASSVGGCSGSDRGSGPEVAESAQALSLSQEAVVTPSDGVAGDRFGISVAHSGGTMISGADKNGGIGAAYVSIRSGSAWVQQAKLTPSDGASGDGFGFSVSVDGNTAIVGSWLHDAGGADAGAAYVYTRSGSTWTLQQKLTASDAAAGDMFGFSVVVRGDIALVGAFSDDGQATDAGAAYVFRRSGSTWTQSQKITASDGATLDGFGCSVSLNGTTAIVGSYFSGQNGAAYVYTDSGSSFGLQQKLTAADGALNDNFGWSVSVDADSAIIGAWGDDDGGDKTGSSYVFTRSGGTWSQQAKLNATTPQVNTRMGTSVAISGDIAMIGSDNPATTYVYFFERVGTTWSQAQVLSASAQRFGYSVSLRDGRGIAGAWNNGAGSATVYLLATAAPGAVTLVSPVGTIPTDNPTYVWQPEPNSTQYQLWVYDGNWVTRHNQTYDASTTCAGGGNCSIMPGVVLPVGNAHWFLRGINAAGNGPWASLDFVTNPPPKPGLVTLTSPTGTIATNNPTYTWQAEPISTQYQLWVYDFNFSTRVNQTYNSSSVCAGGVCSVTPGVVLPNGNAYWYLRGINAAGNGPWNNLAFVVAPPSPPGAVTPISPTGAIGTNNPTYTWQELSGATGYHLWVYDLNWSTRVNQMYTTAVCSGGTCSVNPNKALPTGAAHWYIRAQNAAGFGPWTQTNFSVP